MVELFTTSVGKTEACGYLNGEIQWHFGTSAPAVTWPFQNWGDTGNNLWKQRNETNDDWITRGVLDKSYFGLAETTDGSSGADIIGSTAISGVTGATVQSQLESIVSLMLALDPLGVVKPYFGSTLPSRHLWVDGTTIGDADSNATGRANADTEDLFTILWGSVDNTNSQIKLYDSAGSLSAKGASAAADFAAHKKISLPDKRGRVGIGLDNMGGTSAGVVSEAKADIVGGIGGEEKHSLTIAELVPHQHEQGLDDGNTAVGKFGNGSNTTPARLEYDVGSTTTGNGTILTSIIGGGEPFNIMQPWIACNYIMRY